MKHLLFDTEANGLPVDHHGHVSDVDNWPRMLQLAFVVFDDLGEEESRGSFLIRPDGFDLDPEAARIHGLTLEKLNEGVPVSAALEAFAEAMLGADVLVAHNYTFDKGIVGSEFVRNGMTHHYEAMKQKEKICTMQSTRVFCNLPGKKWPKLQELHQKLFGRDFENAHDALADVLAMADCFFELLRKGVIAEK